MNRQKVKDLMSKLNTFVVKLGEEEGMFAQVKSARYNESEATFKLVFDEKNKSDRLKEDWNENCLWYGFDKEDFGREFTFMGKTYEITGLNPKAKKYPIIGERNGSKYKFKVTDINFKEKK